MAGVAPVGKTGIKEVERRYPISWSGLSHTVSLRGGKSKTIVSNVFGHCEPGQVMAIMGPSGCGKTSLLDLLGGRVGSGTTTGEILIGCKQNPANIRKIVSYVTQEDSLLTCFTVRETLRYASRLAVASLPASKTREEGIQEVMVQMGLLACAETRVGDPLIKGISGGQKRRLSIAIELLQRSPILLLDEPTSGLDSTAAMQVIEHLRDIAQKGHTVVMSIHQAGSRAYGLFDSLCLLSMGQQVYFGPTADVAIKHFAAHGHACPQYSNPAEFFLDIINTDFGAEDDGSKLEGLVRAFEKSELAASMRNAVSQQEAPQDRSDPTNSAGPVRQFAVLLLRMLHMNWKNPYIFGVRLVMYIALAFMVGTMYYDVGEVARGNELSDGEVAATSLLALLFYVQAFLVFMSVAILPFFLEIRDVFRRERANGQITCLPYVLADFIAGLPGVTLIALISTMLVVWLANLNGFGQFFANLLLSLIVAESLMHVIGAAQPHYIIGMAFGAGLFGMFMLCEGFMVKPQDIPDGWVWGYYLAFHTYSFEWFVHNQFDDGTRVGEAVLKSFDMENVDPLRNALVLSAYAAVFQAAYFVVLKVFHTGKR
jgi:ABC-type multidrug transport system ATPase subunit